MSSNEASIDPPPTEGEMQHAAEGVKKTSPVEDDKDSMMPRYIYDTTSSVQERLMQRADAAAASTSADDGETDKEIHPNDTEAKVNSHDESNDK
ncbi:hypothetical protein N0V84_011134 [Fusarium piperis]|uniref:Uncharacterized protein n=1 Tax=Fusarium piperis TaxID=1435070 RepID=A0A9W8W4A9_9HYPO|nr:hypothetical protein N0V84_011134 [Fusarium piperis]